jgi:hypothetical protein
MLRLDCPREVTSSSKRGASHVNPVVQRQSPGVDAEAKRRGPEAAKGWYVRINVLLVADEGQSKRMG